MKLFYSLCLLPVAYCLLLRRSPMLALLCILQTFGVIGPTCSLSQVTLDSSNLPIVGIYTYFQQIPDEPKITAFMGIIDNGYNVTNHVTDTNFTYYDYIGIEKRGSITQTWLWPQKSYNLETRDSLGNDLNVPLMGFPIENDWILYGPYDDYSLMRNVLTYHLARQMGYWAPRTKYCELLLNDFINWNYDGIYVMMEKIKRDKNRVDISKLDSIDNSGDELTGGYIIAADRNINKPDSGWYSSHPQNANVFYSYKYPKGDDITPQQEAYIQAYIDSFENAVSSPNFDDPLTGYRKYMEPVSFMDFFFIQEISKNIDAYKRSAFMYKDKFSKGGKLIAGPHWDYNSAYGAGLCGFDVDTGWTYPLTCWVNQSFPVPFWWERFLQDTIFVRDLKCRWEYLRSNALDTINIFYFIDSVANYISQASVRQFTQYNLATTLQAGVDTLKNWLRKRLAWLDANMPGNCWNTSVQNTNEDNSSVNIYPNPTSGAVQIQIGSWQYAVGNQYQIEIFNVLGEKVYEMDDGRWMTDNGNTSTINHQPLTINLDVPNGMYVIKLTTGENVFMKKIIKTK